MADFSAARISELEPFYQGLFLKARAAVGAQSFGLAVVELGPDADDHPLHDHPGAQEEVYVVLRGTGALEIEGESERIPLDPETIVRVGPDTKRKIHPGPDGMRLLAIGGTPGEAYEAPGYSELGAPDPLAA
ncbi:MAG: cupin domain-containing protein [Solirubrobacterales bacterium]|jgi:mannose-6-phosphate isomerase-like protein (cupin superfamily)|nr:cupin domain-containing protein [Solirubrobacterales bacterium]